MKYKKNGFTFLLLLCMGITMLRAQQSANAAWGDAIGSGGSASFSVGQVAYTFIEGSNTSSNQGVQQPYEFFQLVGINEEKGISLSMSAFPNPTQMLVNLKIECGDFENFSFQLFDISGKVLLTQKISGALTEVPMQNLASGAYILRVVDSQKELKSFKIIKNN